MDQGTPGTHTYSPLRLDAGSVGKLPRGPLRPLSRHLRPARLPVPCDHPAPISHSLRPGSDPPPGLALRRPRPGTPSGWPRLCARPRLARGQRAYAGYLPGHTRGTCTMGRHFRLPRGKGVATLSTWDRPTRRQSASSVGPAVARRQPGRRQPRSRHARCVAMVVARKPISFVPLQE